MKTKYLFRVCIFIFWGVIFLSFMYLFLRYNISLTQVIFFARDFVNTHLFLGSFLFLFLYIIRPFFFIIATPFDLFSGMVFGPVFGFFMSALATTFSGMFTYYLGYKTGGKYIEKREEKRIGKYKKILQKYPRKNILMLRFLMFPYDLTNYMCGAFKLPFRDFVIAGSLGIFPATFMIVSAGSAFYGIEFQNYQSLFSQIHYESLWFASGLFATILAISFLLQKRNEP